MDDDDPVVELGPVRAVYADDVLSVLVVGANARVTLFAYQETPDRPGIRVKVPVITIVGPLGFPWPERVRELIEKQRKPH